MKLDGFFVVLIDLTSYVFFHEGIPMNDFLICRMGATFMQIEILR